MQATIYRPNQEPLPIHRSHNRNFAARQKAGCLTANIDVVAGFLSVDPADVELTFSTATAALYTVIDWEKKNERNHAATVPGCRLFICSEYYGTVLIIDTSPTVADETALQTMNQTQTTPAAMFTPKAPRKRTVKATSPTIADLAAANVAHETAVIAEVASLGDMTWSDAQALVDFGSFDYMQCLAKGLTPAETAKVLLKDTAQTSPVAGLTIDEMEAALTTSGFFVGGLTDSVIEHYYTKLIVPSLAFEADTPAPVLAPRPMSKRKFPFTALRLAGHRVVTLHQVGKCAVARVFPCEGRAPYYAARFRQHTVQFGHLHEAEQALLTLRGLDNAEIRRDNEVFTLTDALEQLYLSLPCLNRFCAHHGLDVDRSYKRRELRRAITDKREPKMPVYLSLLNKLTPTSPATTMNKDNIAQQQAAIKERFLSEFHRVCLLPETPSLEAIELAIGLEVGGINALQDGRRRSVSVTFVHALNKFGGNADYIIHGQKTTIPA